MEEVETKTRKDKRHKQGKTEMDGRPTPGAGSENGSDKGEREEDTHVDKVRQKTTVIGPLGEEV